MTCPFCGAAEYKAVPGEFACGSGIEPFAPFEAKQSDICRELCQLREKKAEGLTWECKGPTFEQTAQGVAGLYWINTHRNGIELWCDDDLLMNGFDDDDAAKAHAEELHQQAWRELRERWDFKGGGK